MEDFLNDKRIWFLGGLCVAAGVAIGLILAPFTHGISITLWSNNAVGSGRNVSHTSADGHSRHKPLIHKNNSASAKASKTDKKNQCCCNKRHKK